MRRTAVWLAVIVVGAVAFLPAGSAPPAAASGPLRLTVGTLGRIGSLDPRHGNGDIAREVWNLQYPTLTGLDPKTLDPAPGVAAAWSPAPGGTGWIYNLFNWQYALPANPFPVENMPQAGRSLMFNLTYTQELGR